MWQSTPKVVDELKRISGMLYSGLDFIMDRERSEHLPRWKYGDPREFLGTEGKNLLSQTCLLYSKILRKAHQSLYSPKDRAVFRMLEDKVIEVGEESSAKVHYSKPGQRINTTPDHHTDEQLVAAAIYSSVLRNTSCSIISNDSDIARLLVQTNIYFNEQKDLWPVSKALTDNPIKVYFVSEPNLGECTVDTSQPGSFHYAYAGKMGRERMRLSL